MSKLLPGLGGFAMILVLACVGCHASDSQGATPPLALWPTTGDYGACSEPALCLCSEIYYASTVCLPSCASDADCPAPPPGAAAPKCLMTLGGLTQFCVLPCTSDAGCPQGYACTGHRAALGPFCAVPGSYITDVSGRYDSTTPPAVQPATPVTATARLCGSMALSGELAAGDLHLNRNVKIGMDCHTSPASYFYYQDVYAIELVGAGPHRLVLDSCGQAPFGMSVMIYAKKGSSAPYDTANICLNLIASADPSGMQGCSQGVSTRIEGLASGIIFIVVTSNGPDATGSYTLSVSSETSHC